MRLLLDTHLLLWAVIRPERLSKAAVALLSDPDQELFFSAVSIWEIAIKNGLGRADFQVPPRILRRALLDNDYRELALTSEHALAIDGMLPVHKDPFDRVLLAQASIEGMLLLTSDRLLSTCQGPVRLV